MLKEDDHPNLRFKFKNNLIEEFDKVQQEPDDKTKEEKKDYKKEQDIKDQKQNRKQRKEFAYFIFSFTCMWCICVLFILICKGLNKLFLSDEIILALIGTTTLNAFVFMRLVTKYLFNYNH